MKVTISRLATLVCAMFIALMVAVTTIQIFQAPTLNEDGRNRRMIIRENSANRGTILAGDETIARSTPVDDTYRYLREYPGGPVFAPVTGFHAPTLNQLSGLELYETPVLGGTDDSLFFQRMRQLFTGAEPEGGSVQLTIDPEVQKAAAAALGDQKGAVVVLNPKTGAIIALVSSPSYDPNTLATHDGKKAQAAWNALLESPDKPVLNRATSEAYAPGSVFKLITTTAWLENTDLSPDASVEAPTQLPLAGSSHVIYNPGKAGCGDGSGQVPLKVAFAQSCNTPFAIAAQNLGQDKLETQIEKFGFTSDLTIPMPTAHSRLTGKGVTLDPNALAMTGFGQRDVQVTPLHMAMVGAAIANKGVLMKPYLVEKELTAKLSVVAEHSPEKLSQAMSAQSAQYLAQMMRQVVTDGTGKRAALKGVEVAGKTGTAELGNDIPPHAWFVGFAPFNDPEVVVAVLVERSGHVGFGGSGGTVAAPIAAQVLATAVSR